MQFASFKDKVDHVADKVGHVARKGNVYMQGKYIEFKNAAVKRVDGLMNYIKEQKEMMDKTGIKSYAKLHEKVLQKLFEDNLATTAGKVTEAGIKVLRLGILTTFAGAAGEKVAIKIVSMMGSSKDSTARALILLESVRCCLNSCDRDPKETYIDIDNKAYNGGIDLTVLSGKDERNKRREEIRSGSLTPEKEDCNKACATLAENKQAEWHNIKDGDEKVRKEKKQEILNQANSILCNSQDGVEEGEALPQETLTPSASPELDELVNTIGKRIFNEYGDDRFMNLPDADKKNIFKLLYSPNKDESDIAHEIAQIHPDDFEKFRDQANMFAQIPDDDDDDDEARGGLLGGRRWELGRVGGGGGSTRYKKRKPKTRRKGKSTKNPKTRRKRNTTRKKTRTKNQKSKRKSKIKKTKRR